MKAQSKGPEKVKFTRKYMGYNPSVYAGPNTQILDTVLKPVAPDTK